LSDLRRDIHWYLRELESIGIDFLSGFGIATRRRPGATGVWVGDRKIASIGITIKRWVTYHGIAVNIKSNDMANFRLIRPCGMDIGMTCLETELGRTVSIEGVKAGLIEKCKQHFDVTCHAASIS
jgi:lipoate-protein ligase B